MIPGIIASSYLNEEFGAQTFTASGTFTVPAGVSSITAVCIGGGASGKLSDSTADGGRGGDLRYATTISVTPGESLTVTVGAGGGASTGNTHNAGSASSIARSGTILLRAAGATGRDTSTGDSSTIGGNIGGGDGGNGGTANATNAGGGGGTGGYAGNGGNGANGDGTGRTGGATDSGAGAGAALSTVQAGVAGGVGLWGTGQTGTVGIRTSGGSGGQDTALSQTTYAGFWGAGAGGNDSATGSALGGRAGAVRIAWGRKQSGVQAAYPTATSVTKEPELVGFVSGTGQLNSGATIDTSSIGIQAGDLIVMAVGNGLSFEDDYAANFKLISDNDMHLSYRLATGTLSSITLTEQITADQNYIIAAFRNIYNHSTATKTYWNLYPATQESKGESSNSTIPSIQVDAAEDATNIRVANSLVIGVTSVVNQLVASTIEPPSGWTKVTAVQKDNATATDGTLIMSYRINPDLNGLASANYTGVSTGTWDTRTTSFLPGEYTTT